jgi:hypothetical protein
MRSPSSRVHGSTDWRYSSKPVVARSMNVSLARPAWMISRATVLDSAMSVPTSRPSHASAHCAELVRRGSTTYRAAPRWTAFRRWWKKIGCDSRAFEPHRISRSVSSTSL